MVKYFTEETLKARRTHMGPEITRWLYPAVRHRPPHRGPLFGDGLQQPSNFIISTVDLRIGIRIIVIIAVVVHLHAVDAVRRLIKPERRLLLKRRKANRVKVNHLAEALRDGSEVISVEADHIDLLHSRYAVQ